MKKDGYNRSNEIFLSKGVKIALYLQSLILKIINDYLVNS